MKRPVATGDDLLSFAERCSLALHLGIADRDEKAFVEELLRMSTEAIELHRLHLVDPEQIVTIGECLENIWKDRHHHLSLRGD